MKMAWVLWDFISIVTINIAIIILIIIGLASIIIIIVKISMTIQMKWVLRHSICQTQTFSNFCLRKCTSDKL